MTLGLCRAVADRVRLDAVDGRGVSERARLEQVRRATGRRPEALDRAEVPEAGAHVWEWFWELRRSKGAGLAGPDPVGFADIKAFADLAGVAVEPWEARALRAMDQEYARGAGRLASRGKGK